MNTHNTYFMETWRLLSHNYHQILLNTSPLHYENTPIQICWKFHLQKQSFQIKISDIFYIAAQNIDCGNSLKPPHRGGSNEFPQSIFLSRNWKKYVYPCKSQFNFIKVGFKGSKLYRYVFVMDKAPVITKRWINHLETYIQQWGLFRKYERSILVVVQF